MGTEKHYARENGLSFRLAVEPHEGRVFIAVGGMQIDVYMGEDGVEVQLQHRNEVLDECSADYPDKVNEAGHGI